MNIAVVVVFDDADGERSLNQIPINVHLRLALWPNETHIKIGYRVVLAQLYRFTIVTSLIIIT